MCIWWWSRSGRRRWRGRLDGRIGHLWQNRFYSCPLGPGHLVAAPAYVDLNSVRAGLVGEARQYPLVQYSWSSAGAHTTGVVGDPLLDEWACSELGLAEKLEERTRCAGRLTAAFLAASQDLSKRWRSGWAGGCIRSRQDRARSPERGAQPREAELADCPRSSRSSVARASRRAA